MITKPLTFARNEQETLAQRLERAASSFKTVPEIVLGGTSVEIESERGFSLPVHPTLAPTLYPMFAPDRVLDDMTIEREPRIIWFNQTTPAPMPGPSFKK